MRVTAEKCSTHSRQNPTIRPEGRTGYRGSGRVPRTRGWLILPPWDKTNSQARPPPPPTRGSWWDAGTFGGAAGNGLDGNKARREVSRLGQRREYGTEGQKRALGGLGAAARDPPKIPGALRRICRAGSQVPAPAAPTAPHLTLPEPLPPPQPKPPQPPRSEPFSTQPPQLLQKASADSAASQADTSLPAG